eukprot:scaffold6314_cov273-Ochromonas_danica.AAC.14
MVNNDGINYPAKTDDSTQVQDITSSSVFPERCPNESFISNVQSATDQDSSKALNQTEDYVSLKDVLANNPPLAEEIKAFHEALDRSEEDSKQSYLLKAIQHAVCHEKECGSMLNRGEEEPLEFDSAMKQSSPLPPHGETDNCRERK